MKTPRVLIADDDRSVRTALRKRLMASGYQVFESQDGLGVVDQALREKPDAIVLDYEMPNGDGCSIAWFIRKECDAPIVFLSGYGRETFRQAVMTLSNVFYLPKPFDAPRLLELLASLVRPAPARSDGPRADAVPEAAMERTSAQDSDSR